MAISDKIISGNDQPNGGQGIVGVAGARGLAAADKVDSNHTVSPFPPYLSSQLDMSKANLDGRYDGRFDDTNYYHGSGSYGGPSN